MFQIKNNNLYYFSSQVKGTWKFDKDLNLVFIIDRSQTKVFGKTLKFKTQLKKATGKELQFVLLERSTPLNRKIQRIELKGSFKSDSLGRLIFVLQRQRENSPLIFTDDWQIDKTNQLYFNRPKRAFKRKIDSFKLKGIWDIGKNHLVFYASGDIKLVFDKVSMERKLIDPKNSKLSFVLGASQAKTGLKKIISLWGKWQVSKASVKFIAFFGKTKKVWDLALISPQSKLGVISFELMNTRGKALGYKLSFKKKLFKDLNFFIKANFGRKRSYKSGFKLKF